MFEEAYLFLTEGGDGYVISLTLRNYIGFGRP
jgi:hypothetical protein